MKGQIGERLIQDDGTMGNILEEESEFLSLWLASILTWIMYDLEFLGRSHSLHLMRCLPLFISNKVGQTVLFGNVVEDNSALAATTLRPQESVVLTRQVENNYSPPSQIYNSTLTWADLREH